MKRTNSRTLAIDVPENFSFESTVLSHGWVVLAPFRWDPRRQVLSRTEHFEGLGTFDVDIRFDGRLILESDAGLRPVAAELRQRISRMFQLDVDTSEFLELCAESDAHREAAERRFGRLLCGSTPFEDIIKIIATTNTRWLQTRRMIERLVERFGEVAPSGHRAFPTAARLARASEDELRQTSLGYRSRSIHQLSRAVVEETLPLRPPFPVSECDPSDLAAFYRRLPGIGPYGAAHLMAMDGRYDQIAVDTEFRRFVSERYHAGRMVKDRTMLRRYDPWGRWRYLAYWSELWQAVRQQVTGTEEISV